MAPLATERGWTWDTTGEFTGPQLQPYSPTVKRLAGNPSRRRKRKPNPLTLPAPVRAGWEDAPAMGVGVGAAAMTNNLLLPLVPLTLPAWQKQTLVAAGAGLLLGNRYPSHAAAFAGAMLYEPLQDLLGLK